MLSGSELERRAWQEHEGAELRLRTWPEQQQAKQVKKQTQCQPGNLVARVRKRQERGELVTAKCKATAGVELENRRVTWSQQETVQGNGRWWVQAS